MTLQEALEEVRNATDVDWNKHHFGYIEDWIDEKTPTAIATILNAVVKGELK